MKMNVIVMMFMAVTAICAQRVFFLASGID
jgi:hypothetical protein